MLAQSLLLKSELVMLDAWQKWATSVSNLGLLMVCNPLGVGLGWLGAGKGGGG